MFRVSDRERVFFTMFIETADRTCKAASLLEDLVNNYEDVKNKVSRIEDVEHECDNQVHKIIEQVNRSFITPIDREDINLIAKELDNITDFIESTAHRFIMYNISNTTPEAKEMAKLITNATQELRQVLVELENMKKSKLLKEKVIEVNRLEDVADDIYREAITKLFVTGTDALEVIKWKEVYQYMENTLDACEDVANIVEGVVMKHV